MNHSNTLESDWLELFDNVPEATRGVLREVVRAHKESMADAFYARMLGDPDAHPFLTHEAVETRLRHSMQRWLETLFSCTDRAQFALAMAMQRHVGEVHARIDLPVNIVARGARVLKAEIARHLLTAGLSGQALIDAVLYADNLMDLAFEEMSAAYVASHEHVARIDEAYRTFSFGQNLSLERERQRAALLDWENRFLHDMMTGSAGDPLPRLTESAFGLWLHHKATAIFEGAPELPAIRQAIRTIDDDLIPQCQAKLGGPERDTQRRLTKAVLSELGQLKFLLGTLFERFVELESGKDALTQLLNRRFLPAILSREADISRRQHKPFALLLLDVDHFKHINDQHGHEAGDRVLQHIASLILATVRAGDFVFRYGGEEFLALLVEVDLTHALRIAEKLRSRIESESVLMPNGASLKLTASIGVAVHDGHPDYQRLINRADEALYRAKQQGRNRCVVSDA
ncbi:diguanylate cyclase [Zoogloeaceae bacteirum Par-f-2]|nr:diguanylate cyclase [Zoogloeaceae bacteirum Par-f-2]